jgi:hypothetical protein
MTWILTHTGRKFDPMHPRAEDVDPLDIAHSLAHLCRFNGHVRQFYSVAEHSVRVAQLVSRENKLQALLHDAAEAYIGDITRPLKRAINDLTGGVLTVIERGIHHAICDRFGIDHTIPDEVHHADLIMLATERRDLMPEHSDPWECLVGIEPVATRIALYDTREAHIRWLHDFEIYSGETLPCSAFSRGAA